MKLIIDRAAIDRNIVRAEVLAGVPVSIILKSFYDYIYTDEMKSRKVFSMNIDGSVCYSIGGYTELHSGTVVTNYTQFRYCWDNIGIQEFYIPINAHDNREGLPINDAVKLSKLICAHDGEPKIFAMITGGCISPNAPTMTWLSEKWHSALCRHFDKLSIGGSFFIEKLAKFNRIGGNSASFISDLRIGEYILFGTIPYYDDYEFRGDNALTVQMDVVGVYRDRGQIVVKGGYTSIDTKNCSLLSGGLQYVNTSSDYTIYTDPFKRYSVGDIVEVVPDYYSLVKLTNPNVEKVFI